MEYKFYERWQPWMIYCIIVKKLDKWYEMIGVSGFYNRKLWKPVTRKLSRKYVKVKFLEC